jgi:hypothetical protein
VAVGLGGVDSSLAIREPQILRGGVLSNGHRYRNPELLPISSRPAAFSEKVPSRPASFVAQPGPVPVSAGNLQQIQPRLGRARNNSAGPPKGAPPDPPAEAPSGRPRSYPPHRPRMVLRPVCNLAYTQKPYASRVTLAVSAVAVVNTRPTARWSLASNKSTLTPELPL